MGSGIGGIDLNRSLNIGVGLGSGDRVWNLGAVEQGIMMLPEGPRMLLLVRYKLEVKKTTYGRDQIAFIIT